MSQTFSAQGTMTTIGCRPAVGNKEALGKPFGMCKAGNLFSCSEETPG
jgi:hypothetical protein